VEVIDLRRLETVRRDLVANVSHELRTPVTTIRSAAETLRDTDRDDSEGPAAFLSIWGRRRRPPRAHVRVGRWSRPAKSGLPRDTRRFASA